MSLINYQCSHVDNTHNKLNTNKKYLPLTEWIDKQFVNKQYRFTIVYWLIDLPHTVEVKTGNK